MGLQSAILEATIVNAIAELHYWPFGTFLVGTTRTFADVSHSTIARNISCSWKGLESTLIMIYNSLLIGIIKGEI